MRQMTRQFQQLAWRVHANLSFIVMVERPRFYTTKENVRWSRAVLNDCGAMEKLRALTHGLFTRLA